MSKDAVHKAFCVLTDVKNRAEAGGDDSEDTVETRLNTLMNESIFHYKELQELQELFTHLVSDIINVSTNDQTKDLVNLLYIGNLCRREAQKQWISTNVEGITPGDLVVLTNVARSISTSPLYRLADIVGESKSHVCTSYHKKSLDYSLQEAKKFVNKSKEYIRGSRLSYADLSDKLNTVIASNYINTQVLITQPNFSTAEIIMLWDFKNCVIPVANNANKIGANIISGLRYFGYCGPVNFHGFGSEKQIKAKKLTSLTNSNVNLHHHFVEKLTKESTDVADKKIMVEIVTNICKSLLTYEEPQLVVLICGDIDFLCGMKEVKEHGFRVVLIYEDTAPSVFLEKGFELADHLFLWSDFVC